MFNKTRRKIVLTVVLSLVTLMTVTLATIYVSNRLSIRRENEETLATFVRRYTPDGPPALPEEGGEKAGNPDDRRGHPDERDGWDGRREMEESRFQLSTFYAVSFDQAGNVVKADNGNEALIGDEELVKKASAILESGKKSGVSGALTFLVEEKGDYTLVAMIDGTISENNQQTLLWQMLLIGSAALAVLVVISVFLARRIVRPLEENDARQKRFVSDAGHELKTPIAVISANSELLKRQIGENEWLANIDYENERMSDLVKQLLALSRAESGTLPAAPLDLSKLVDGEVLPFETLAFEKGVEIKAAVQEGIRVDGDANQLRQLVSILLDNALSHGTGRVISLSLSRERHNALLTVTNLSDVPPEKAQRLFERFYRADEARGEDGSHYGLGLSIAQAITKAHGGAIRVSVKEGFVTFTVSLPAKKSDP